MYLYRVISGGPRGAGTQKFCHAGFEVAAFARVFLSGREVGQLANADEFGGHHHKLIGHAGELEDWLTKLYAVERVLKSKFKGDLRYANCAGSRLDAGAFEGCHQMPEALAFLTAQ